MINISLNMITESHLFLHSGEFLNYRLVVFPVFPPYGGHTILPGLACVLVMSPTFAAV